MMFQDIRVVCYGSKKTGPHSEEEIGLIGWTEDPAKPEFEFVAYAGPTAYGRPRRPLWEEGRLVEYKMLFTFECTTKGCTRKDQFSFDVLRRYAVELQAAGLKDTQGRFTLNLSQPPTIGSSS